MLNTYLNVYHESTTKYQTSCIACLPFVYLSKGIQITANKRVIIGAQDVFWKDNGAFTGMVSSPMLSDIGIKHCIIGHSERRGRFSSEMDKEILINNQDNDKILSLKLQSLLDHDISPIACIGETLEEKEPNANHLNTEKVLDAQLKLLLSTLQENHDICQNRSLDIFIAYEPVWAIGTGKECHPELADEICGFIHQKISKSLHDSSINIKVLYGGSVNKNNVDSYMSKKNIDGVLVGGASFKPEDIEQIIRASSIS